MSASRRVEPGADADRDADLALEHPEMSDGERVVEELQIGHDAPENLGDVMLIENIVRLLG
eukprot:3273286-Rhodomonas_salina.4